MAAIEKRIAQMEKQMAEDLAKFRKAAEKRELDQAGSSVELRVPVEDCEKPTEVKANHVGDLQEWVQKRNPAVKAGNLVVYRTEQVVGESGVLYCTVVDVSPMGYTCVGEALPTKSGAKQAAAKACLSALVEREGKKPCVRAGYGYDYVAERAELAEQQALDLVQAYYQSLTSYPLDLLETIAQISRLKEPLQESLESIRGTVPRSEYAMAKERIEAAADCITAQVDMLNAKGKPLYDSWEDEFETVLEMPMHGRHREVKTLFEKAVKITFPFREEAPEFEQNASHVQMNTTRLVGATHVYLKARKLALQVKQDYPSKRVGIVDIGAGGFGITTLSRLKALGGMDNICIHAMSPVMDHQDLDRRAKSKPCAGYSINDMKHGRPMAGRTVNVCTHKCRDCTCLAKYDHIVAVSVHAAYELLQVDFDNLFCHTERLWSVEHVPEIGADIPTQEPEYRWERAEDSRNVGFLGRAKARFYKMMTGHSLVTLTPLRRNCTTYSQVNTRPRIENGGFQSHPLFGVAETLVENPWSCMKVMTALGVTAATTSFLTTPGDITVRTACGVIAGLMTVAGTVAATRLSHSAIATGVPIPGTTYTVHAKETTTYCLAADHDPLVSIMMYTRSEPGPLFPNNLEQIEQDAEHVGRVAATIAMAGNTDKAKAQAAAVLFRDRVPVRIIRGTLYHASRMVNYLADPGPAPPERPVMGLWSKACILLPFAWVCRRTVGWMIPAPLSLPPWMYGAVAPLTPVIMPITLILSQVVTFQIAVMAACLVATFHVARWLQA
jgi:hypothetical protein